MRTSLYKHAGLGLLLGMIVGSVIAWLSGGFSEVIINPILIDRMGSKTAAIVLQTLVSGVYGAAAVSGMLLYDVDEWSLAKATIVHYLIVAVPYVPMALFLGWAESAADILIVEGFQLIAFFLIWSVMVLRYKAKVKKLNELVKEWRA